MENIEIKKLGRILLQNAGKAPTLKQIKCANCDEVKLMNSHSMSEQFLKNIANDKIEVSYLSKTFGDANNLKENQTHPTSVSGTFRNFCSDCDSKLFWDYENREFVDEEWIRTLCLKIAWAEFVASVDDLNSRLSVEHQILNDAIKELKSLQTFSKVSFDGHMQYSINRSKQSEQYILETGGDTIALTWRLIQELQNSKIFWKTVTVTDSIPIAFQGVAVHSFGDGKITAIYLAYLPDSDSAGKLFVSSISKEAVKLFSNYSVGETLFGFARQESRVFWKPNGISQDMEEWLISNHKPKGNSAIEFSRFNIEEMPANLTPAETAFLARKMGV